MFSKLYISYHSTYIRYYPSFFYILNPFKTQKRLPLEVKTADKRDRPYFNLTLGPLHREFLHLQFLQ